MSRAIRVSQATRDKAAVCHGRDAAAHVSSAVPWLSIPDSRVAVACTRSVSSPPYRNCATPRVQVFNSAASLEDYKTISGQQQLRRYACNRSQQLAAVS